MTGSLTRVLIWIFNTESIRKISVCLFHHLHFKNPVRLKVGVHFLFTQRFDRLLAMVSWKFGFLEKHETKLMKSFIEPGMNVIDIGANIGHYSLHFSRWVGRKGKVFAFEPENENYSMLCLAKKKNGYENLTVENAAVGATTEATSIYVNPIHGGDHRIVNPYHGCQKTCVMMRSLDDYFSNTDHIQFIKMDIQGAEYFALTGMKNLILREKKIALFTEFTPFLLKEAGCNPKLFLEEIKALNFTIMMITKQNGLQQAQSSDEVLHLCETDKSINLFCLKGRWSNICNPEKKSI